MFHRVKCSHYAVQRANHDPNMFTLTMIGTTSWGSFDLAQTRFKRRTFVVSNSFETKDN